MNLNNVRQGVSSVTVGLALGNLGLWQVGQKLGRQQGEAKSLMIMAISICIKSEHWGVV